MDTKKRWEIVSAGVDEAYAMGCMDEKTLTQVQAFCAEKQVSHGGPSVIHSLRTFTLGVLGAGSIMAGIIALLATNWRSIPQSVQIVFALIPLTVVTVAYFMGARRGLWERSEAWREVLSVFWIGSAVTATAMTARIYQLPSDSAQFGVTVLVMIAPLLYLLRTKMACSVFGIVLLIVANLLDYSQVAPVVALVVGGLWLSPITFEAGGSKRLDDVRIGDRIFRLGVAIWLPFMLVLLWGFGLELMGGDHDDEIGILISLFVFAFGVASYFEEDSDNPFKMPIQSAMGIVIFICSIILIFGFDYIDHSIAFFIPSLIISLVLGLVFKKRWQAYLSIFPLIAIISGGSLYVAIPLMLVASMCILFEGVRLQRQFLANVALLMSAISVFIFFVQGDLSLTAKGLCLITFGIGFLFLNICWSKLTREVQA